MRRAKRACAAALGAILCILCAHLCAGARDAPPTPAPYAEMLAHLQAITARNPAGGWQYRLQSAPNAPEAFAEAQRLTPDGREICRVQWRWVNGGWQPVYTVIIQDGCARQALFPLLRISPGCRAAAPTRRSGHAHRRCIPHTPPVSQPSKCPQTSRQEKSLMPPES